MDTDRSCDLYMYTSLLDHPEFQFTDSDGDVHSIRGRESCWGHYNVKYNMNVPLISGTHTRRVRPSRYGPCAGLQHAHSKGLSNLRQALTLLPTKRKEKRNATLQAALRRRGV